MTSAYVPEGTSLSPALHCASLDGFVEGLASDLPEDSLKRLAAICSLQVVPAGRVIWRAGDRPGPIGFVISGYLRLQCHGRDGNRQILSLLRAGDLVGELPGRVARHTLEASTETRICRVSERGFSTLMHEDADLRRMVHRLCIARRDQLRWLTWAVGALDTEERICALLLAALDHMPVTSLPDGTLMLTIDLPRSDIADLLGTSVETISRVTNRLAALGIIEIVNARQFRICDLDRLARKGCQIRHPVPPTALPATGPDAARRIEAALAGNAAPPERAHLPRAPRAKVALPRFAPPRLALH
jgi:CRP/FNR family transcriptional regulator